MPLTTRRALRVLTSGVLAFSVALGTAAAATGDPADDEATRTASTTGTSTLARTAVVTPGSGPVAVSVLMPITVAPSGVGLLSAEELTRHTGALGSLTRQLDAVAGTPVTIGVDPMILASIRALGSAAPPSAAAWLARLGAVSNEIFLLAYADADLVAATRTGTVDALTPTGFAFALDPANFAPVVTASPEPSPSPSDTAEPDPDAPPTYPTTAELLAWTTELPAIAWPGSALGAEDLAGIAAAGYTDVVVDSTTAQDEDHPLVELEGIRGIVVDRDASDLLDAAARTTATGGTSSEITELLGSLSSASSTSPGRGIVLALDRATARLASGLPSTIAAIGESGAGRLVTLSDILASDAVPGALVAGTATPVRDDELTRVTSAVSAELAFSSVLSDPAPLLDPRTLERIALYAVGWQSDEPGRTEATGDFLDRSQQIVTSVQIQRGSDALLLAHSADFRVTVSNALEFPVTVMVGVDPQSPILRAEGPVELTVEAQAKATASIPVEAVANGELFVEVAIASPTGVPVDAGISRVSVQAEWEGIGTLVVVLGLVLVFGAGIVRLIVKRRRARVAARAAGDDTDD